MKKRRLKDKLALLREREKRLRAELTAERETSAGLSRRVAELAQELHAAGARAGHVHADLDMARRDLGAEQKAHAATKRALEDALNRR